MMRRTRSHYFEGSRPRVEVIPMIDIMMFLLVFFVVISLRMIAGTGVAMELPGSATTQQIKTSTVTVGRDQERRDRARRQDRDAGRAAHAARARSSRSRRSRWSWPATATLRCRRC